MSGLGIKDVAAQTGIAAGTIRMWEQRFGFPDPARTSAGYRVYASEDVDALRRVSAYRRRGLSVPAAIERAREGLGSADHPSIYAAVAGTDHGARPQTLRKSTLIALSRAIEHETLAQAASPMLFAAFQSEPNYREVEGRYKRMSRYADAAVVFADFPEVRRPDDGPAEIPILEEDKLGNEWAVIVDAPGYCACLLAWELPLSDPSCEEDAPGRQFESIWTVDPHATRRAAQIASRLAARADAALGEELDAMLADRPLAMAETASSLTALTNRMVAYLEEAS